MAYSVTGLPAYVQENHDLLVKNFALVGGGTRSRISIQTGVKKDAYINILNLTPTLQSGVGCGFDALGNATLSQRTIETAQIKVNLEFCEKDLLGKYAEYLVKVNAVDNPFPFEQYITDALVVELNKKIEKLMWQGDKTAHSTDSDLKWINGFINILGNEATEARSSESDGKWATAYDAILAVYNALPEEVLEMGAEIYVSPAAFRAFMQEMVTKNYFHYNPGNDEYGEFLLPGTDAKVVRIQGLAGTHVVAGTYAKNLVYGTDGQSDNEKFDVWFSRDNRTWRIAVEWNSGVQIAFPDMAVYAHISA